MLRQRATSTTRALATRHVSSGGSHRTFASAVRAAADLGSLHCCPSVLFCLSCGRSYSIASRLDKSSEEDKGGGSSVPVGSAGMIHSPPGTEMPSFSFGK